MSLLMDRNEGFGADGLLYFLFLFFFFSIIPESLESLLNIPVVLKTVLESKGE